jgi:hypothetical protein
MKHLGVFLIAVVLVLSVTSTLAAESQGFQSKSFTRETETLTATVEAIEAATRTLTLKGSKGNYVTIVAPEDMKRFSEIKVGDTITAKYYDTVVVRLKPAGEKSVDTATEAATPGTGAQPAGTLAKQRVITATIDAIDPKVPSITFKGPNNWSYSSRIQDKNVLKTVKVGDRVDITWTEAVLLSIDSIKKK